MKRFLVTWRNRDTQRTHPVGALYVDGVFAFKYLDRLPGDFRPFINFPHFDQQYVSKSLFPFFSQRVMDSRRPDYAAYLEALGLPPTATQLDVLGRSGGGRKGDTVEVVAEPAVNRDGSLDHKFLVRGVRYQQGNDDALNNLAEGDPLQLVAQPENQVNPRAQLVCRADGTRLGWMPDALLDYVLGLDSFNRELSVDRVNLEPWPSHMRLVARLRAPSIVGGEAFADLFAHERGVGLSR